MAGFVARSGATALVAATAKTLVYLNSGASSIPVITELSVSCDGTAGDFIVELCHGTAATNSTPGTGSTAFTPIQVHGFPVVAALVTAGVVATAEPTVLTVIKDWEFVLPGGPLVIQFPLGREPTAPLASGGTGAKQLAVRVTASTGTPNARASLEWQE